MKKIETNIGNRILTIEHGELAKQSDSAVLVKYGETIVLVTVVSGEEKENTDFFPLICDYREQTSAAGKIPGGFFKREGKPSDREILVSRLIDRSIRPLFPDNYFKEIQIVSFVLSVDQENDPDFLSIIGASSALCSSKILWQGPIGVVKIGLIDDKFVINPTISQFEKSKLSLTLSGTENSIIMVEGWAKEISEEKFLEAIFLGFENIKNLIEMQKVLISPKDVVDKIEENKELKEKTENFLNIRLPEAYNYPEKKARKQFYEILENEFLTEFDSEEKKKEAKQVFENVFKDKIRKLILTTKKRIDGRNYNEIRPIECKISLLPRTHGSSLFTRGQTQCLASVTLGTKSDEQTIDGILEKTSKRFMLHYNFPPFSVGEISPLKSPSRREIGHGILAENSLSYIIPEENIFPYTIRIIANVLESNGSSSMATVCAGSLALMDAGVPIKKHVAGVSTGMIKEDEDYMILTDIAGEEDHYGDLDFKIAGTNDGITGFQMDVKSCQVNYEILKKIVNQSKEARIEILEKMNQVISSPKSHLSPYAPKISILKVNPDKIGLIIGPGGKTIRKIIEETGVEIDILDEGEIRISSPDKIASKKAEEKIRSLTEEPEIGKIYEGTVTKIFPFGAMVRILSSEGMVHISELAPYRVDKVEDIVKVGSPVKVKVIGIDEQGRINLSRKQALSQEELSSIHKFKKITKRRTNGKSY